jgi:hypothetical protein
MRAYVIVTGVVWVLILGAHVARLYAEGGHLLTEPSFLVSSLLCLGLAVWAGALTRRAIVSRRSKVATGRPADPTR